MITKMKEENKKQEDLNRNMTHMMIQSKALNMSAVPTALQENEEHPPRRDRVHRRVILHDYGQPLCEASSRIAMLAALEGGIRGMWT
jgi:hypothetical protein